MLNLVLAVTMETVYQAIKRDVPTLQRVQCYTMVKEFPGLCFLCLTDSKNAMRRLFP